MLTKQIKNLLITNCNKSPDKEHVFLLDICIFCKVDYEDALKQPNTFYELN